MIEKRGLRTPCVTFRLPFHEPPGYPPPPPNAVKGWAPFWHQEVTAEQRNNLMRKISRRLWEAQRVVVLTGAGISTSSGIPDSSGIDGIRYGALISEAREPKPSSLPSVELAESINSGIEPNQLFEHETVAKSDDYYLHHLRLVGAMKTHINEMEPEDISAAHGFIGAALAANGKCRAWITTNVDGLEKKSQDVGVQYRIPERCKGPHETRVERLLVEYCGSIDWVLCTNCGHKRTVEVAELKCMVRSVHLNCTRCRPGIVRDNSIPDWFERCYRPAVILDGEPNIVVHRTRSWPPPAPRQLGEGEDPSYPPPADDPGQADIPSSDLELLDPDFLLVMGTSLRCKDFRAMFSKLARMTQYNGGMIVVVNATDVVSNAYWRELADYQVLGLCDDFCNDVTKLWDVFGRNERRETLSDIVDSSDEEEGFCQNFVPRDDYNEDLDDNVWMWWSEAKPLEKRERHNRAAQVGPTPPGLSVAAVQTSSGPPRPAHEIAIQTDIATASAPPDAPVESLTAEAGSQTILNSFPKMWKTVSLPVQTMLMMNKPKIRGPGSNASDSEDEAADDEAEDSDGRAEGSHHQSVRERVMEKSIVRQVPFALVAEDGEVEMVAKPVWVDGVGSTAETAAGDQSGTPLATWGGKALWPTAKGTPQTTQPFMRRRSPTVMVPPLPAHLRKSRTTAGQMSAFMASASTSTSTPAQAQAGPSTTKHPQAGPSTSQRPPAGPSTQKRTRPVTSSNRPQPMVVVPPRPPQASSGKGKANADHPPPPNAPVETRSAQKRRLVTEEASASAEGTADQTPSTPAEARPLKRLRFADEAPSTATGGTPSEPRTLPRLKIKFKTQKDKMLEAFAALPDEAFQEASLFYPMLEAALQAGMP